LAAYILTSLFDAEKKGRDLERRLQDVVSVNNWTESLGRALLVGLKNALKRGDQMGSIMKEAFDKAVAEATDFAKEHPVYCTLIALGILVLLVPWAIEALGFAELGPVEGEIPLVLFYEV
jgi:hypothetical protein